MQPVLAVVICMNPCAPKTTLPGVLTAIAVVAVLGLFIYSARAAESQTVRGIASSVLVATLITTPVFALLNATAEENSASSWVFQSAWTTNVVLLGLALAAWVALLYAEHWQA